MNNKEQHPDRRYRALLKVARVGAQLSINHSSHGTITTDHPYSGQLFLADRFQPDNHFCYFFGTLSANVVFLIQSNVIFLIHSYSVSDKMAMNMFLTSGTDVARTIRNARTTAGLSQTELASQVGVGRQSIARIEAGNAAASLDTFLAIFRILNITLEAHTHDERQNVDSLSEHWSARLADQARGLTKTSALTALLGVNRTQDSAFNKVSGDGA